MELIRKDYICIYNFIQSMSSDKEQKKASDPKEEYMLSDSLRSHFSLEVFDHIISQRLITS